MAQEVKIEGKNFLITGGASGLGAAYAEVFLKYGAKNVAILDIAEKAGKDYTEKLNETYKNKVVFFKCDVSKEEEIKNSLQKVLDSFNTIDVIVNNAGIMDDSADVWRTASDLNWQGLVSFTMKGIEHMRKDKGGSGGTIVNISSVGAFLKSDVLPIYNGSKAAVLHFGRSIASPEFYDATGIRILTICFWATATPLLENLGAKLIGMEYSKLLAESLPVYDQSIVSAVEAFLKMFREGEPGSVWLSTSDQPGQDITAILDEAYAPILKLAIPAVTKQSK